MFVYVPDDELHSINWKPPATYTLEFPFVATGEETWHWTGEWVKQYLQGRSSKRASKRNLNKDDNILYVPVYINKESQKKCCPDVLGIRKNGELYKDWYMRTTEKIDQKSVVDFYKHIGFI